MKRLAIVLAAALCVLPPLAGCSHRETDDGTAPAVVRALPPLSIKDDTPDLMLTWIDDKGDSHVELCPTTVPAAGRAWVRVVVSDREDGTHDLFYVADLTQKHDDGTYATRTVRRREWEAEIEKRRDVHLALTTPPRPAASGLNAGGYPAAPEAHGAATVIIYGASWCGPCHQAADYLKSRGIPYVMKDVEQAPGAAAEMAQKLARIGRSGGSIPVIDVRGQILVGFSRGAIDAALARSPGSPPGTTL